MGSYDAKLTSLNFVAKNINIPACKSLFSWSNDCQELSFFAEFHNLDIFEKDNDSMTDFWTTEMEFSDGGQ